MDDLALSTTAPAAPKTVPAVRRNRITAGRLVALLDRFAIPILALLLLVAIPMLSGPFRLGLFGKYLSFSFCAVGLVLAWGYGGILSLGQGIFFGLGSYLIAMFMKLEATSADPAAAVFNANGPPVPDFMTWNSVDTLPWWWVPFEHLWFALAALVILPAGLAFTLAYANFRKRVGSVYFSIVTLALAGIMSIVIIGQQGYTGGINGITNLTTFAGYDIQSDGAVYTMYYPHRDPADRLCAGRPLRPEKPLWQGADRDPRPRRPHPLLWLRPRALQGDGVRDRCPVLGDRRCALHIAGRLRIAIRERDRPLRSRWSSTPPSAAAFHSLVPSTGRCSSAWRGAFYRNSSRASGCTSSAPCSSS